MTATAADIRGTRTPCRELYSRVFSSRLSPFLSAWLLNRGATPNQVTVSMLGCGVLGAVVIAAFPHPLARLAGILAFVFLNVLDTVDGEMARFSGRTSTVGIVLDKVIHVSTDFMLYSAVGFALAAESRGWIVVVALWVLLLSDAVDTVTVEAGRRLFRDDRSEGAAGVFQALAGNVAFYHLFGVFVLLDWWVAIRIGAYTPAFQTAYFVAYAAAHLMRTLARLAGRLQAIAVADRDA